MRLLCWPAVAHLLPTVPQPVSLLPAPGALGPSAAVAPAAAAAAAAQQQQFQDETQDDAAAPVDEAAAADAAEQQALRMAGAVLEQLLTEAWADEDMISAFHSSSSEPAAEACKDDSQQQQTGSGRSLGHSAANAARPSQGASASKLGDQNVQAFAEYVLDNALLGTLQEGLL